MDVASTVIGILAAGVTASGLITTLVAFRQEKKTDRFDDLVTALEATLKLAGEMAAELEKEADVRRKAVEQLRVEHKALELSQEERAALDALFDSSLRKSGRQALLATFLISLLFFALGVGVTLLIS